MKRRETIKRLALSSGMIAVLPAWTHAWEKSILPDTRLFSAEEYSMLSAVADTIIPEGEGIGAVSVGVPDFLSRLFAECYEPETQARIGILFDKIEASAQGSFSKSFTDCTATERLAVLNQFASSGNQELKETFYLVKNETVRGFRTSKEVMVKYLDYEVAPGRFIGCKNIEVTEENESD